MTTGKVDWGITIGEPRRLLLFLKVIEEAYDDLAREGVLGHVDGAVTDTITAAAELAQRRFPGMTEQQRERRDALHGLPERSRVCKSTVTRCTACRIP